MMKIKETKILQESRLEDLCLSKGIDYHFLKTLLESVKTKKLFRKNNYHSQKINDIIEKSAK